MKTLSSICKPWQRLIAALVVGGSLLTSAVSYASDDVIRVTGIPDENPTELARKNQPMVDYLEKKLGKKVTYVAVTDSGHARH